MSESFGDLLRLYRRRCTDLERGGALTQERLGELLGRAIGNLGYSGAAISEWEHSKSKIHEDHRWVLEGVVKVLFRCGGLHTPEEADALLLAGNYRPLNEAERRRVFGAANEPALPVPLDAPAAAPPAAGSPFENIFAPLAQAFRLEEGKDHPHPGPERFLQGMRFFLDAWSSRRVWRTLAGAVVWALTWGTALPSLQWPFADAPQAQEAILRYVAGALVIPLLIGLWTPTRGDPFWEQHPQKEALLRFYTHLGAGVGFHAACAILFALALVGHSLGIGRLPGWAAALAALWPAVVGLAAARQVPVNGWRVYGVLRFRDGAIFSVFVAFGPAWGWFLYTFYPLLLAPWAGAAILVLVIGVCAALARARWPARRAGGDRRFGPEPGDRQRQRRGDPGFS